MAALKSMTRNSLLLGWWSPMSLFFGNPITLILNFCTWLSIRRLPAPGSQPATGFAAPAALPSPPPPGYGQPQQWPQHQPPQWPQR